MQENFFCKINFPAPTFMSFVPYFTYNFLKELELICTMLTPF